MPRVAHRLGIADARRFWLHAQRLDVRKPFGSGPAATARAVEHLGYVQIDTINVIERSHHHILFTRIPDYRRADLVAAQSEDKTVFEYWTHALAYVPTRDFRFFIPDMKRFRGQPVPWFGNVPDAEMRRVLKLLRDEGALTIRDIDDEPVEKTHPWDSRKPSKRALQRAFFEGRVTISRREGMLKTYELMERHFDWPAPPKAASAGEVRDYLLDRHLRAQGLFSATSVMHPRLRFTPELEQAVARRVRRKALVPVTIGDDPTLHWTTPETLDTLPGPTPPLVHILSPFDPLTIQRRRLSLFFGYDHVFEAYIPKVKRRFGYFTLPVLFGDAIVAVLDLKADRAAQTLLVQAWHWVGPGNAAEHKRPIEEELTRFAAFQFGD
jgi:hypothetical protein